MDRKKVLVYRGLPAQELERVRAEHDVIEADPRQEAQEQAFFEALPFVHGMIGSGYRIDDSLLAQAPLLKVISTISVGIDHFALDAMKKRGVTLCHTPGVLTEAVADLTFALILGTSRRVLELGRYVQQGRWRRSITAAQYGWDVHGKTLGILGYGRIGKAVARRAALGFGMPVLYYTRSAVDSGLPEGKACPASLNDVLTQSDFLVVMLPLTEATRGMIGPEQLAMMKPEAILINAARGPVVQEDALLDALDHGRLRAAGLDVFDTEPLPADSPLRDHPSVLALPHAGSATHETRAAMAHMAVDNLLCVLRGDTPPAAYPLDKAD